MRCELHACKSKMLSIGDVIVRQPTDHHRHALSCDRVSAAVVVGEVRRKATECESTTKNIVQAISRLPCCCCTCTGFNNGIVKNCIIYNLDSIMQYLRSIARNIAF